MLYYKRIDKIENGFNPNAYNEMYNNLKAKRGVITSTDENGEFILIPCEMDGEFIITSVSRDDIKSLDLNDDKLSDADMSDIADKMADYFLDYGGYWDALEDLANEKLSNADKHRILDTDFGEVCLKEIGTTECEVYIGDNYDTYICTISCAIDDDDDIINGKLNQKLNR